ncbi:tetratricopeptide repeat protein [Calothrix sp. PCC 7507]|uniref:tetratricopeptide repeat protein n=1 Tax=Calothrix sp. PCC 7507 TaxID=99598 RepID=UPI00029F338C|nr:tetratricopeptide repeat protein [Calothrix sp. PCC 7507]AFY35396.1 Tetratricopeptide TPR_1 repeat-containing protein [Calothrix sp. PCC 7507]
MEEYKNKLISHYKKALTIKPDRAVVHSQLGELYDTQGNLEEAIAAYRRAIALNPYLASAYHKLAQALGQGGWKEKQEAVTYYRRAIELEPNLATSSSILQIVFQPKTTKVAIANPGNNYSNSQHESGIYWGSNYTILWSQPKSEKKIGIYASGACHLASIFASIPMIQSVLKGKGCLIHDGDPSLTRSDILLQTFQEYPVNVIAEIKEKFKLTSDYFQPRLFEKTFTVPGVNGLEEFPKTVVIISIAGDVIRTIYRHRESGFLVDPGGWWLNHPMSSVLNNLSTATWLKEHFERLGKISVEAFFENYTKIIKQLQQTTSAHILVFNLLALEPGKKSHNYQFAKNSQNLRRKEFNLALVELSRQLNFSIVDIDRILKNYGINIMLDIDHFPLELNQTISKYICNIFRELEVF